ncbi:hypothetical protein GCM10008967_35460 [Bacillus carboniphilus]|uniref:YtxH domain-containing protein n=1 Tax=Bacillus carboniphilus TaxID=86663 RepID=A0ABN0WMM3_9BACI
MGNSKFLKGVMWGALIGGAVTLLDKETRQEFMQTGKKAGQALRNPKQTTQKIKEKVQDWQEAYEHIRDDVTYISDKLYELKDVPPKVTDIINESKKAIDGTNDNNKIGE